MLRSKESSQKKTIEEYLKYLSEIIHLKMFFTWNWLKKHPEENIKDVLRERVSIYYKTNIRTELSGPQRIDFEDLEWLGYEKQIEDLFVKHINNPEAFENEASEVFRSTIEERAHFDFASQSYTNGFQCGSLRYDLMEEGKDYEIIGFHIANAIQPLSIFNDPKYLPKCFLMLMDETEKRYNSKFLQTTTWLNSLPRWLEIFPEEWQENLSEPDKNIKGHNGFWGQFINARGTFNFKYANILRKTTYFPFYPRKSNCSFKEMRKHLKHRYNL